MTTAPRYLWWTVTACLVVLTACAALRLRYVPQQNDAIVFDTWRGGWCMARGCVFIGQPRPVLPPASPGP